jgi:hypothetical protein
MPNQCFPRKLHCSLLHYNPIGPPLTGCAASFSWGFNRTEQFLIETELVLALSRAVMAFSLAFYGPQSGVGWVNSAVRAHRTGRL